MILIKACFDLIWTSTYDILNLGVYANDADVRNILKEKYETLSGSESKGKDLKDELMDKDIRTTVRLQIVYGRLSIRSVRTAFEESVGNRIQKFGGSDSKELLLRYTFASQCCYTLK